jgi:LmbE family N-acetylglucosaminyl deacetylase
MKISSSLFFFAHQDDEFGVFQKINDEIFLGNEVYCIYLTTGVKGVQSSSIRNSESISVLSKLGVKKENIIFSGDKLRISDGKLIDSLFQAKKWLKSFLIKAEEICSIYIPAWEGGHHDHDALHAIVVLASKELGILDKVWQFPLYNAYMCRRPFFRVLLPLHSNGPICITKIKILNRANYIFQILEYRSQLLTWVGLMPFVLIHYLFSGAQSLQKVQSSRILERPHIGQLYYESRKFSKWEYVNQKIIELIND